MDFFDTTRPGLIPAGSAALLYADGRFTASKTAAARLGPVRWITVLGGAAAARYAGCGDFEQFNPLFDQPDALRQWALYRKRRGERARIYSDLDNLPEAIARTRGLPNVLFWIAAWMTDGQPRTIDELIELAAQHGARLEPEQVWAHQFLSLDAFDKSALLGTW